MKRICTGAATGGVSLSTNEIACCVTAINNFSSSKWHQKSN